MQVSTINTHAIAATRPRAAKIFGSNANATQTAATATPQSTSTSTATASLTYSRPRHCGPQSPTPSTPTPAGVISGGKAAPSYYGSLASSNSLGAAHYPEIRDTIARSDLTVGYFVGKTKTYTNQQVKDYFAGNPSPEQLADTASRLKMSAANAAQALTIAGADYDPTAVKSWVAASKDYALGPDDIIVKLQSGQTKNSSGLLEGSWSSDPGNVSYTQWAREWYAAGNANLS